MEVAPCSCRADEQPGAGSEVRLVCVREKIGDKGGGIRRERWREGGGPEGRWRRCEGGRGVG